MSPSAPSGSFVLMQGLGWRSFIPLQPAMYWIGFPEWLALGAVSIIVCTAWVGAPASVRNHATGVAQNLISVSMVVTSWAIGVAASLISDWPKLRWRQAFVQTRDALALLAALTVVQVFLFPHAGRLLDIFGEVSHNLTHGSRSFLTFPMEFFGQTLVAPGMSILEGPRMEPSWGALIISAQGQGVPLGPLPAVIFLLWGALLAFGLWIALRGAVRAPVLLIVVGTLGYLFVLHGVFGGEIFFFSIQFAPFLVFIAMWSAQSRHKLAVRAACIAVIAASAMHNYPAFASAAAIHNQIDRSWLERNNDVSREVMMNDCR